VLLVTVFPVQASRPLAVSVDVTEHASSGTAKLPLKLADAPGANEGTSKTGVLGPGWLLTTVTFVSVMLPLFLTVPL
jgi:hypothetical protein